MAQDSNKKYDIPQWAHDVKALYECDATNQFILNGNVNDRLLIASDGKFEIGNINDFMLKILMPQFDVVIIYDIGKGIEIDKGLPQFLKWPSIDELKKQGGTLPKQPRAAIECIGQYIKYESARAVVNKLTPLKIGVVIRAAHLVVPQSNGSNGYDLSATASLIRDWTTDTHIRNSPIATFLLTENLSDLNELVANNTRAARISVPLPPTEEIAEYLKNTASKFPNALYNYYNVPTETPREVGSLDMLSGQFVGVSLCEIESMLKQREHRKEAITNKDLLKIKKEMIEKEADGLIEFIESNRKLADFNNIPIRTYLAEDIRIWQSGDLKSVPMGYLLTAPTGCGKGYLVECVAGETGEPFVKINSFRDKYQGVAEAKQEKIIRILKALGRVRVFFDEADQLLGNRNVDGDGGVSGRIYAKWATEMSDSRNRGKIQWWLASSRCDLIEIDFKRPGRVDIAIPILPSCNEQEGFDLLAALCRHNDVALKPEDFEALKQRIPTLLTAGAAEAIAVKARRYLSRGKTPLECVNQALNGYQPPVKREILDFQIKLAVEATTDTQFVPKFFQEYVQTLNQKVA